MDQRRLEIEAAKIRAELEPVQDETGVDLTLIRANLRLSPAERVRRQEQAADDLLRLREYGRRHAEDETGTGEASRALAEG